MEDWVNELNLDMIPEPYNEVAKIIGVENFIKLAKTIGGATIYIPKADSFLKPVRDMKIKEEFNGYNHLQLARKYNLSVRWIIEICGEGNVEGQISIFDARSSS